ncbi:MAG: hypothetical protein R6U52_01415 [Kosmotogaceae bacterium]
MKEKLLKIFSKTENVVLACLAIVALMQGIILFDYYTQGNEPSQDMPLIQGDTQLDIYEYLEDFGFNGVAVRLDYNTNPPHHEHLDTKAGERRVTAYYSPTAKLIVLHPDRISGSPIKTLWHEYAHYIWSEELSPEQMAEYQQIYINSITFPTPYSLEGGLEEDFTETVESYKTEVPNLDKNRISFMHKIDNQKLLG